jgi:tRNA threonylcarbamoyl adenosine modification protein YeaZ
MRILAIDTALGACAAAVYDSEAGARIAGESLAMARGHAEALLPLIARVMDRANLDFDGLDRIAVTVGPGSFTGLRVGIAAARGIALAAGRPAVGVSTLAAYAAPQIAIDRAGTVVAAIDARQAQVYCQVFGAGGRTTIAPRHLPIAEAVHLVQGAAHIAGSAAQLLAAAWPAGEPAPVVAEAKPAPDIDWVARLGAAADAGMAPPKPLYLRPPDARPQDAARLPRR